ncbi:MORC family CW-type zinc finger protein 3-like isoform X4 [Sinocyclocheilus anshuiensis]|uniref:MORC family CW-type zinc finger protein 3-like isoform X4 n=1 Tax=Sinocyclocheilus anshuiensis TaxID=1608454 RepID=UPI0007B92C36|nr:PREDICTED: MORC family CW-type zinc finger protein 3-like isoform X4 [Sinocyclocheilus anshuiensis]
MAARKSGIPLSTISPKFLHANSTSHTWPFSAIAELIDNSYDPDVRARQIWIDWTRVRGLDCLSFMDNGEGLTRARLHKMLSFGFSEKKAAKFHIPIGVYGNGFKSGSMRLGKDAIVFTKTRDTMSVGLLSQSYLEAIGAQRVLVPMITFRRDGHNHVEDGGSLRAILTHSLFNSEKELFTELRAISAAGTTTGTRIIIWNLRTTANGETEFDFDTDKYDILIRVNISDKSNMTPESEYSLRAERKGVGVIGVIECNFLQPTHNKQDFDDTDKYRKIMHNLSIKLEEYWNEIRYKRKKEDPKCTVAIEDVLKVPDQVWVQCDSCLKWRRLPDAITELPDKWFCSMNYDPQFRSCLVEEELEDEEEDQKSYPKPFKLQRRNTKSLLEENIPESTQTQDRPALTTIQAPRHPAASAISGPSLAERSPLPLINLTAVSNSLRRAKQKFSAIETQMEVTSAFPVLSLTPPQELFSQTHWPALNEERKTLTQSDTLVSKAACGMMEGIESHQGPTTTAEETCERDASSGTEREYSSAAEQIIELPLKNEKKWVVHHEGHDDDEEEECNLAEAQQWQDELMELMHKTAEERDACRQELEVLREHSAALEDERNRLISRLESAGEEKSKLSALCDQLRSQLAELREQSQRGMEEKDDSSKLRTLRLNLSRLLVSFIPSLHLEHVDYNSDVIDTILIQSGTYKLYLHA